jgi:hypothetical protein
MKTSGQRLEIPASKSKIILMLLAALAFVAVGLWFVISPPAISNSFWGDPTKIAIVGYASIIVFGLCAFWLIRKIPDSKPALVIDDTGLVDNSGFVSAGEISWSDIEGISVIEIQRQKLIMVHVKNPKLYIERQTSVFKRKSMELNNKMYGTPISITANGLKISFESLWTILTQRWQQSRDGNLKND